MLSTLAYLAAAERAGATGWARIAWGECHCDTCRYRFNGHKLDEGSAA